MNVEVDVQYATTNEPDMPDSELLTSWVNTTLQYIQQSQEPTEKKTAKNQKRVVSR